MRSSMRRRFSLDARSSLSLVRSLALREVISSLRSWAVFWAASRSATALSRSFCAVAAASFCEAASLAVSDSLRCTTPLSSRRRLTSASAALVAVSASWARSSAALRRCWRPLLALKKEGESCCCPSSRARFSALSALSTCLLRAAFWWSRVVVMEVSSSSTSSTCAFSSAARASASAARCSASSTCCCSESSESSDVDRSSGSSPLPSTRRAPPPAPPGAPLSDSLRPADGEALLGWGCAAGGVDGCASKSASSSCGLPGSASSCDLKRCWMVFHCRPATKVAAERAAAKSTVPARLPPLPRCLFLGGVPGGGGGAPRGPRGAG
mmetsp:Transcript_20521/g.61774  ORF Transcript_20521/g.61774 Transcript_20521/m.61774 type:complete len:325 (+) Transcript_20521:573-1547(+)